MPNPLQLSGARPSKEQKKGILYQGGRFTTGLWTNRAPIRDAASTRYEERYFGPRGDSLWGGENIEISNRLTLVRRFGNSVWNNQIWSDVNQYYSFRLFDSRTEDIKVMVDTKSALYDGSNNGQIAIWNKSPYAGQSYPQSVGNILYWGDGADQKKWINTLQTRIPYSTVLTNLAQSTNPSVTLNPYNFIPFQLDSFIIDPNGNAEQLIATVIQLSTFYILNNTLVFTPKATDSNGNPLPTASQVLSPGLQIFFPASSIVAEVLSQSNGVMLTIEDIVGPVATTSVYFGGQGYTVGDTPSVNQSSYAGSTGAKVRVSATGTSEGAGYSNASGVATSTSGGGTGCTLDITTSGGRLISGTVSAGGSNYVTGDFIFPLQANASGGYFLVTASTGIVTSVALCTGVVTGVTVDVGGTGYKTAENVSTTGGTGTGLAVNIVDSETQFMTSVSYPGGSVANANISSGGSGYAVGDRVYPVVPVGSGTGAEFDVASIYGTPATISLGYGGPTFTGYTVASGLPTTTSGSGTGATFDILSVSSGQIATYSLGSGGSNYTIGDWISPTQTGDGALYSVSGVYGPIGGASLTNGGPSFTGYTVASNIATTTLTGSGSGATFDILTVSSGQIATFSVGSTPGTGYNVGDTITPTQPSGDGAVFTVATLTGGAGTGIATLTMTNPGFLPYTTGTVPTTTNGSGTGATIDITAVSGSQITAGSIVIAGTGYAVGDFLYPTESGTSGTAYFTVTSTTNATGSISSVSQVNPGFLPYTTGTVPTTTSGTGSGATIDITAVTSASITSGTLGAAGTGYATGDRLYPTESGTSGNAYFTVETLSSATGAISSLSIVTPGTGYSDGTFPLANTTGTGSGAEIILAINPSFYPTTSVNETPQIFTGGNPISSYTPNDQFVWSATEGAETVDGSALWVNRGPSIDGGLVFNWGMEGGTTAPVVTVNGSAASGWEPNTYYTQWSIIVVTVSSSKYVMQIQTSGKSGGSAPTWNTTVGQTTTDGTAVWLTLSNDGDTSMAWAAETQYTAGHVLEETAGSVNCVFQLQPFTGIMTEGNGFPVYGWQCNSESGVQIGTAGQIPTGTGAGQNGPMATDGGQPTTTATWSGSINSLFLYTDGSNPISYPVANGDGTIASSNTQLFPGYSNLSVAMLPNLVIPTAGIYTFQSFHQNGMFWGIGAGSIALNVTRIQIQGDVLTVKCDKDISSAITPGINLSFPATGNSGALKAATFLNGLSFTVTSVFGSYFTADFNHANYGPAIDSGLAESTATLLPSVISGPMNWQGPAYDFSTGTPIKGYPIMSSDFSTNGAVGIGPYTVQISFPAAGIYPAEIQYGFWYHSTGGYSTPTVSPTLPTGTFSFYLIYQPPTSSTWYNIIPESLACSNASAPTWPAFPTTLAGMQAIAPKYPSITEESGNFTWWNLGPVTSFNWQADVNYTTSLSIIDPNSNIEVAYEPGVSGTTEPTFGLTLYSLAQDLVPLVWMNNGAAGSTPAGGLTTTQGGWKYCVAPVNTLDDTVANASLVSLSTGDFFDATGVYVTGGLPSVIDPQADYVAVFRTDDGGANYYLIPPQQRENGNTEYTLPLSEYLTRGFTDTTPDSGLNTLIQAALAGQNTVPPQGSVHVAFAQNRLWVAYKNVVQWSSGPNTPVGNGFDGFDPNNYAEYPSLVINIVPLNIGMLIQTVSDQYIITGGGTVNNPYVSSPLVKGIGTLSSNAVAINGSILYFMTTDNQVLEMNIHSGYTEVSFPIADIIQKMDPASSYLTWHVKGSTDKCLFVGDGSTGWYRLAPTAPPESGSLTWSPKATITSGAGAINSIETSPGDVNLLIGPPPGQSGPILFRDYNSFSDDGQTYPAYWILGSIVMAYQGQVAGPEFVASDCLRVPGSRPLNMGVLIGEVSGDFQMLTDWTYDPPQLPPSNSLWNQRFWLSTTRENVLCRHMMLYGSFDNTDTPDEVYTLTVCGGFSLVG